MKWSPMRHRDSFQQDVYLLATFAQVTLLCERAARAAAKANDKNRQARFRRHESAPKKIKLAKCAHGCAHGVILGVAPHPKFDLAMVGAQGLEPWTR